MPPLRVARPFRRFLAHEKPNPGEGYRLLSASELTEHGDERHTGYGWEPLRKFFKIEAGGVGFIRRRIAP